MSSVLAALAPGTQWSQKPNVSLPAACAPRTYGAVISAADVSAVAATNCRRESLLRDMTYSLPGANHDERNSACCCYFSICRPSSDGCRALWRFRLVDQSRIAGVCREISLF